jgi:adenosylhomocysteine nucleosidase
VNAIKPNGNVDMWKVMRGIARNPRTIPHLISTGRDFNRALRSLRGCRSALG